MIYEYGEGGKKAAGGSKSLGRGRLIERGS
jgi:hypothetical protein